MILHFTRILNLWLTVPLHSLHLLSQRRMSEDDMVSKDLLSEVSGGGDQLAVQLTAMGEQPVMDGDDRPRGKGSSNGAAGTHSRIVVDEDDEDFGSTPYVTHIYPQPPSRCSQYRAILTFLPFASLWPSGTDPLMLHRRQSCRKVHSTTSGATESTPKATHDSGVR